MRKVVVVFFGIICAMFTMASYAISSSPSPLIVYYNVAPALTLTQPLNNPFELDIDDVTMNGNAHSHHFFEIHNESNLSTPLIVDRSGMTTSDVSMIGIRYYNDPRPIICDPYKLATDIRTNVKAIEIRAYQYQYIDPASHKKISSMECEAIPLA